MALKFTVRPGYTFSNGEKVTYGKLNLLGSPRIEGSGTIVETDIEDGSISTEKLKSSININSKIDDHNLGLNKLAQGTHGQVLYYDAEGDLVTLPPGTSGYFLSTNGVGKSPSWKSALTGDGTVAYNAITTNGLGDQYLTTNTSGVVEWIAKPQSNSADVYTTSDVETVRGVGSHVQSIGYTPEQIRVTLLCQTNDTDTGYNAGDELEIGHNFWADTGENRNAVLVIYDDTTKSVRIQFETNGAGNYRIQHKTAGNTVNASAAILGNFAFKIRTWQIGSGTTARNNAGPLTSEAGYFFSGTASDSFQTMRGSTNASGRTATFSHGFGAVPRLVKAVVVLTEAISELGYAAGDEIDAVNFLYKFRDTQIPIVHTYASSDSVKAQLFTGADGNYATVIYAVNSSTTVLTSLTADQMSKMKLKVYVWK